MTVLTWDADHYDAGYIYAPGDAPGSGLAADADHSGSAAGAGLSGAVFNPGLSGSAADADLDFIEVNE